MNAQDTTTDKQKIRGGYFKIARVLYEVPSAIWLKLPLYLKFFIWIVGKALYELGLSKGFQCERGEFVTTYDEIRTALAYKDNRKLIIPTRKQITAMLTWMQRNDIITYHGVKEFERPHKEQPSIRTRYYVATKITVTNYDTYQSEESYRGAHKEQPSDEQGETSTEEVKKKEKDSPPFFSEEGKKSTQQDPRVQKICDRFVTMVADHPQFNEYKPRIGKNERKLVEVRLKEGMSPEEIINRLEFFLGSDLASKSVPSVSIGLSEHMLNTYDYRWTRLKWRYPEGTTVPTDKQWWWG
jgi:hypothetical protein